MQTNTKNNDRNDIQEIYKWDLTHMISSDEQWIQIYNKCIKLCNEIKNFQDKLEDGQNILSCLDLQTELLLLTERLYVYSHMKLHEDTRDNKSQERSSKTESLQSQVEEALAFIEPELLQLDKKYIDNLIKSSKELSVYSYYINNIFRKKEHTLSKEEEELLSKASDFNNSVSNIFSMFNEADVKFSNAQTEDGSFVEVTKGNYLSHMQSNDRILRKNVYTSFFSTYSDYKNTLASIYSSHVKKQVFNKNVRNFPSCMEAALFENNIDSNVYHRLIKTVNDYLPIMHRYVYLRKKVLKVDTLHYYDLYTSLVNDVDIEFTYETAKEIAKKALSILGDEYIMLLETAFDNRWIDVYENVGKRSGAYSWRAYNYHPHILLNYTDKITDLFTLVHEIGHAIHSYYSNKHQHYINAHYKIFLAEIASTVNETLLMHYLRNETTDKNMQLFLMNYFIEKFRGTVFRQTMFAEFELKTHNLVENNQPLTADNLSNIYQDLNSKYYGNSIESDDLIKVEWARIPHFYYNFYVYQYATGFSSAIALSNRILTEGHNAVDDYFNFLKSGNSDAPLNILKKAGVDMTTNKPISSALDIFEQLVLDMEKILL